MLTDLKIKKLKASEDGKGKKYNDSSGLYLYVSPAGGKVFRFDYSFGGKRKTLTIGKYPIVSLGEARDAAFEARKSIDAGNDPAALKKNQKLGIRASVENTFEAIANDWFEHHMGDKSESHRVRTRRLLDQDLIPQVGKRPIKEITPQELLGAIRVVERRTIDIAYRCLETCNMVFKYAVIIGVVDFNIAQTLKGALKPRNKKHYPAITNPIELGRFLNAVDEYSGSFVVKAALRLTPLLFQRPKEIRTMEWADINWEKSQLEIPASRMKMSNDHIVPLAKQSLAILESLQSITGTSKYVFTSMRGKSRPLSDNGVRTALRVMGYSSEDVVPHGFRATARTLLDEELGYRPDWIEMQLAHSIKDPLGRAYNRTSFLKERHEMMQVWSDYLDTLKSGSVHD